MASTTSMQASNRGQKWNLKGSLSSRSHRGYIPPWLWFQAMASCCLFYTSLLSAHQSLRLCFP